MTLDRIYEELVFPECPRWRDGALWFSDCHDGRVVAIAPDGRLLDSFGVPGGPSGLGWLPSGEALVVSIADLCVYRRQSDGSLIRHADLSSHHRFHANDMVVDDRGNGYVGEVGFRGGLEAPKSTVLLLVRPDGAVSVAADDMLTPNGSVITADGGTLIVAESLRHRLMSFTIAADGTLHDRRLFAELDAEAIPDGICLDEAGCIWVASPRARAVLRVSPKDGVVDRIDTGATRPYACMLGGADRRDLFVCLADTHDAAVARKARSGAIAFRTVDVAGCGRP
ncbi:SMP-30/gluconolactonase/LRE family protein [Sphingomonas solaris]|uniref:SMP-30/gluconolactonase/LRE family protein n=1 Tax=Alterirhizorhabdus solaris TaxID=2529389 RepID=UPI001396B702|nr:SMP-30/gluconolactonase/LRE family protein [Sphingomonas solaris]